MSEVKFAFEDLKVYRKSLDFIDQVYDITNLFPKEETYRLTSQFIRAANSTALNIAEVSGDTDAQFKRYLTMAANSVRECVVCSKIAQRQNYISKESENDLRKRLAELKK